MRKRPKQFLNRRERFMTRFNGVEMREFKALAKKAALSRQEYSRRRILGLPIVDIAPVQEDKQPAEAQSV